jgi:hypothetical protein
MVLSRDTSFNARAASNASVYKVTANKKWPSGQRKSHARNEVFSITDKGLQLGGPRWRHHMDTNMNAPLYASLPRFFRSSMTSAVGEAADIRVPYPTGCVPCLSRHPMLPAPFVVLFGAFAAFGLHCALAFNVKTSVLIDPVDGVPVIVVGNPFSVWKRDGPSSVWQRAVISGDVPARQEFSAVLFKQSYYIFGGQVRRRS